jgi:hypothetical protein
VRTLALGAAAAALLGVWLLGRKHPVPIGTDPEAEIQAIEEEVDQDEPGASRRSLAIDIHLIRGLEVALTSDDILGNAQRLGPRARVEERADSVDFDVVCRMVSVAGQFLYCTISVHSFRETTARWDATCTSSHPAAMPARLAREVRLLERTERGFAARREFPEVVARARTFRDETLGVRPAVEVPAELQVEFVLLTSTQPLVPFARRAGIAGAETEGYLAGRAIADAGRFDILRNILRGPSSTGRAFAAVFLLERARNLPDDDRVIRAIRHHTPRVMGCSGCVCGVPISVDGLFSEAEAHSTDYALGLLPLQPRPIIRPGFGGQPATIGSR